MLRSLSLVLQTYSLAILIRGSVAADISDHELDIILDKRQNYTCSNQGLQDVCETNSADCIAAMCESCSGYVFIANCCALASYTAMLQCLLEVQSDPSEITMTIGSTATSNSPGTSTITAPSSAAPSLGISGADACSAFEEIVLGCENATPGFSTEAFSRQTSCLCYSNGTYQPDLYDGMFAGCLAYLSTATPAEYSSIATGSVDFAPCKNAVTTTTQTHSSSSTHYIGYTTTSTSAAASTSATPSSATPTGPTQTPEADRNGSAGLGLVSRTQNPRLFFPTRYLKHSAESAKNRIAGFH
ncbi:hypothetical protein AYO20_01156 [Fonsecaea nubica]|uniref:Extracellular membrane protein CFEM domain-containing protein n=1 Tax=Fonsecaea nubica TaxID=856822 RepID=A0A178DC56_9EURO|nr:hypothetical protein AYO20_01156 [Fonsecaea nubica]OAL39759.1 hypothetical protein AYO20_01156 [Fonsecaea nubica]